MVVRCSGEAELREDRVDVRLDRLRAEVELAPDACVRTAFGHQLEHAALAFTQRRERVTAGRPPEQARTPTTTIESSPPLCANSSRTQRLPLARRDIPTRPETPNERGGVVFPRPLGIQHQPTGLNAWLSP